MAVVTLRVGTEETGPSEGPTPDAAVIDVRGLVKNYGSLRAVDGVSFQVQRAETLGLLGPNGAGKTSVMRVLSGLSPVDAGTVHVAGIDALREGRAVRRLLGVVTQSDGLDPDVNVRQNLELYGFLAGLSRREARARTAEVLRFFGLTDRSEDDVDDLSGGMRRRLAIARALVCLPPVVVLDEPTTGLDPHSRTRVWEELAQLKSRGVSILMSTHYMEEAATLCDRVAIMDRGRILALAPPPVLVERHAGRSVAELRLDGASREKVRSALTEAGVEWSEVGVVFRIAGDGAAAARLESIPGIRLDLRAATLEDVYLGLTGKELRDE
jgi:lipooligosaccharide transport system ATP-binding protein